MPNVRKNRSITQSTGGLPAVTPIEVDRVRRSVLDIVRNNIPTVREVLNGDRSWSNQQVRLFGMMLNKVMPDLHHTFNEHTIENKKAHELTIEELEQIALQATQQSEREDKEETMEDTDDITDAEVIDALKHHDSKEEKSAI
ncbi:MAG: hypothetical protein ACO23K_01175 [Ilumatobacteraceae bacterium]